MANKKVIGKQEIKKNVIPKVKEKVHIPFAKVQKIEGKFEFEDKDKVVIIGTGTGKSIKKDTEHIVSGDTAKNLIHAGKAKFLKIIKNK